MKPRMNGLLNVFICMYISGVSTPGPDGGDSGDTDSGFLQEKEKCGRTTAELH